MDKVPEFETLDLDRIPFGADLISTTLINDLKFLWEFGLDGMYVFYSVYSVLLWSILKYTIPSITVQNFITHEIPL